MLISFVGGDEIGKKVLKSLLDCGIDTRNIGVVKDQRTEVNIQLWDKETKDYKLERGPAELSQLYTAGMVEKYRKEILASDFVILVSKQPKDFLLAMIEFCFLNNIPTILTVSHPKFDINQKKDFKILGKVSYIAGNFEEIRNLTGRGSINEMLCMLPNILLTKGAEGVFFCDENGNMCHEPAIKVENIVELNGAGDTFAGNFVVYRAEGKSITESVRRAQCAAALEIQKMGVLCAMPYREETDEFYRENYCR